VKFRLREQERKNEEKRRRSSNKRHKKYNFLLFSLKIKEISIFLDNLSTFCEK